MQNNQPDLFRRRLGIGIILLAGASMIGMLTKIGIFYNLAWIIYGLSFIIRPVYPANLQGVKNAELWVRVAGGVCILIGLLVRMHY